MRSQRCSTNPSIDQLPSVAPQLAAGWRERGADGRQLCHRRRHPQAPARPLVFASVSTFLLGGGWGGGGGGYVGGVGGWMGGGGGRRKSKDWVRRGSCSSRSGGNKEKGRVQRAACVCAATGGRPPDPPLVHMQAYVGAYELKGDSQRVYEKRQVRAGAAPWGVHGVGGWVGGVGGWVGGGGQAMYLSQQLARHHPPVLCCRSWASQCTPSL